MRKLGCLRLSKAVAMLALVSVSSAGLCAADARPAPAAENARQGAVAIKRDAYGVPHVYADTTYGIFYGFGYALAEDQLFQMEMLRRTAEGSVAEILGAKYVEHDVRVRQGWAPSSIAAQYEALDRDDRAIFDGYAAGYNARVKEVLADRKRLMPREFTELGVDPVPWTPTDVLAGYVHSMALRFSDANAEIDNLALLTKLKEMHGAAKGQDIFDQLRWKRDDAAPTTIVGAPAAPRSARSTVRSANMVALSDAAIAEQTRMQLARYGRTGPDAAPRASNVWVVAPKRNTAGETVLVNGPQMGDFATGYIWSVGLHGAGFDVVGSGPMGSPWLIFGTNGKIGWGATAGMGDTVDVYQEKLSPTDRTHYLFNGQYRRMDKRSETILVKDGSPRSIDIYSTVHGTVTQFDDAQHTAYSRKRSWDGAEVRSLVAWVHAMKTDNFSDWRKAIAPVALTINNYYADKSGNIGYVYLGKFPIRPAGQDIRLPASGTGDMEWLGFRPFAENPWVLNPAGGTLANWNNKPTKNYDNPDYMFWSKVDHVTEIQDTLGKKDKFSTDELWEINREFSYIDGNARYFLPFIESAIGDLPAHGPVRQAAQLLVDWDRKTVDPRNPAKASTGYTIFAEFLAALVQDIVGPTVPKPFMGDGAGRNSYTAISESFPTMGAKVAYYALSGPQASVRQTVDLLNGRSRGSVIKAALETAVAKLTARFGPAMDGWVADSAPHDFSTLNYAGIPQTLPRYAVSLPGHMNRGTENNRIVFNKGGVSYCDVTPPGQSGFIKPDGEPSPHARDQLRLYAGFACKPLWLSEADVERNTVEREMLTYSLPK